MPRVGHVGCASEDFLRWVSIQYKHRQERKLFFNFKDLLGEPCWDILLDLTAAALARRPISVTSACIASGVPQSTALRWINALEQNGLIERCPDPIDKRRTNVAITAEGLATMEGYYRHCTGQPENS